jgi:hypothetical protein
MLARRLMPLALFLALTITVAAQATVFTSRLKFARGRSSATVENAVVRGDRDDWIIGAKAGQRLRVSVTALEKNAAFQIRERKTGRYLRGATEMDDATQWSGRLPRSGDYIIRVGGTRGNASYKLHVAIR